jgi:hypothetical protein
MEFAEARAAFFQPRDDAEPGPDTRGTASLPRRLRHVLEPLAMVQIWSVPAQEQMAAAGLNFLTGYVGGRGCTLGDVDGSVVAATFGVFEPGLIADLWAGARATCSVAELRALREAGARAGLQAALDGVATPDVERAVSTLRAGIEEADVVARPLFASLRGLPWPDDAVTALWHVASLYREHRGDTHLAACAAADVDAVEANILTELWCGYPLLEYTSSRAWSPEAMDAAVDRLTRRGWLADGGLTDAGSLARTAIEDATDRAQERVVASLGDLEPLIAALTPWADAVLAREWFPPDPYKRAAG